MVCLRSVSCALLALAAAPGVLANPVANVGGQLVQRQHNGGGLNSLAAGLSDSLLGGLDTSSPTQSPSASASATNSPTSTANTPTTSSSSAGPTSTAASPSQTINSQTTQQPVTTSTPVQASTQVETVTAADGRTSTQVIVHTLTASNTNAPTADATSASATPTDSSAASAATGTPADSKSTGVPTGTIVGAVVGGVAGLVLIGALGAFAYRVWGKNRGNRDEDDGLMDDTYGTSEVKTTNNGPSATPFQSNLEQYHAAGPAQNF